MWGLIMYPRNDEEQAIGRDSGCMLVRETAVGVSEVSLESFLLTLIPPPQSHGENDAVTCASGNGSALGT